MAEREQQITWIPLDDFVGKKAQPDKAAVEAAKAFDPLPYPAGNAAKTWLQSCVDERPPDVQTWIALRADNSIVGFYSMYPEAFNLHGNDSVIMRLRRGRNDPGNPQPAMLLAWVGRSASRSDPGFGRTLFGHALGNAESQGAVAMIVDPFDEQTAKLWTKRRFMPAAPEPGGKQTGRLWFAVIPPSGNWPS